MFFNINSTSSIKESAHAIVEKAENALHEVKEAIESAVEGAEHHIEAESIKDSSRIVHALSVTQLAIGKDITIRFDSAIGEVKRIVVNGETTVEGLIAHLRGLA